MTEQDVFDMAREVCGKWPSFMSNQNLQAFAKQVEKRKCEELAKKIEAMPFGTTGESFAVWIREQA